MTRQWWRIGGLLGFAFPIVLLFGIIGLEGDAPGLHPRSARAWSWSAASCSSS